MSYQKINIPEVPTYQQMQELQYEVTKRMNVYLLMQVNQVSQTDVPGFVFAGTNAKLSLPTFGVT